MIKQHNYADLEIINEYHRCDDQQISDLGTISRQNSAGLRIAMLEVNTFFNLVAFPNDRFYKKYIISNKERNVLIEMLRRIL